MKQTGIVTAVDKKGIDISVIRSTACGDSCASCSAKCELRNTSVTAGYKDGIKVGDRVVFEMKTEKVMFAAVLVYIVPLVLMLVTYIIASFSGMTEGASVLTGAAVMVVWFIIMHFFDKKVKGYYKHNITGISVGEGEDVRL